jgi:opacity protein-like surface antigen
VCILLALQILITPVGYAQDISSKLWSYSFQLGQAYSTHHENSVSSRAPSPVPDENISLSSNKSTFFSMGLQHELVDSRFAFGVEYDFFAPQNFSGVIDEFSNPEYQYLGYKFKNKINSLFATTRFRILQLNKFSFYAVAGVGVGLSQSYNYHVYVLPNESSQRKLDFDGVVHSRIAYQGGLQLAYEITPDVSVLATYRYYDFGKIGGGQERQWHTTGPTDVAKFNSGSLGINVIF